jgi:hypothetical protein
MDETTFNEAIQAVNHMNDFLFDVKELDAPFTINGNMYYFIIELYGYPIWSSQDDNRHFYEESNKYEPFEVFMAREAMKIGNMFHDITSLLVSIEPWDGKQSEK